MMEVIIARKVRYLIQFSLPILTCLVTIQPNPTITRIYIRDAFTIGFS